jgi:hypothetical protein
MLFTRSRNTLTAQLLTGKASSTGVMDAAQTSMSPIEVAFRRMNKPAERLNAMKELLDVKVNHDVDQDFSNEGIQERISRLNKDVDNAKLRADLRTISAMGSDKNRLFDEEKSTKSASKQHRPLSKKASLLSPNELLDIQISEIQDKIDNLNSSLALVLKKSSYLAKSLSHLEAAHEPAELVERRTREWNDCILSRENISKKIQLLDAELHKKEKERS